MSMKNGLTGMICVSWLAAAFNFGASVHALLRLQRTKRSTGELISAIKLRMRDANAFNDSDWAVFEDHRQSLIANAARRGDAIRALRIAGMYGFLAVGLVATVNATVLWAVRQRVLSVKTRSASYNRRGAAP